MNPTQHNIISNASDKTVSDVATHETHGGNIIMSRMSNNTLTDSHNGHK